MKEYTIQFSGLAEGNHQFSYVLEKSFFDHFEGDVIQHGRIEVEVDMEKQTRMLIFNMEIHGIAGVTCDRCADPLNIGIKDTQRLIVRIGDTGESTDDDLVFISEEDFEFDLSQHLFDYVNLMLPMRFTHDQSIDGSKCDPEMIKLLEKYSIENQHDKRWSGLEGLTSPENEI